MTMRDEVSDPWGWLLAGLSGGLTWAVLGSAGGPAGLVAGAAVGAAVLGTKVVVGAAVNRERQPSATDALPSPPRNSPAATYVERAQRARASMFDIARRPADPWLRAEVGRMDDGADAVVASMRDLAGRVTLADQLLAKANGPSLVADRATIAAQLEHASDALLDQERRKALAAVDDQLAGLTRLVGVRDQLLARMQTAAIGMETVATRMGEVVTLGTAAFEHDRASDLLADAGQDLEALRSGLAEAQQLARGVGPT